MTERCMQNLMFEGQPCPSQTCSNHVGLATHAANRKTELTPKVCKVPAAQMTHVHVLQLVPNPLIGIQVRCVGRELLHRNLLRCAGGQQRAHLPLMHGRAIPDHQPLAHHVRSHMVEKDHPIQAIQRLIAHHRV